MGLGMFEVVNHIPRKHKALSSNFSTAKNKKKIQDKSVNYNTATYTKFI
jgi:hypothetical protein